jgi:predicted transcriptional regulator of viral defense system
MNLDEFLEKVRGLPVINTEHLLAGVAKPGPVQVQISRWRKSGKLIKLKNNIYLLSENLRKLEIYEFHIASLIKKPSYISLEKAFEYYGLIPEGVAVYTSVTTKRPEKVMTPIGTFDYRHIKNSLFWGYKPITVNKQLAFIALPEKALLDYFYLKGMCIDIDFLDEMRLQSLEEVNLKKLLEFAEKFKSPGILKAAKVIEEYAIRQKRGQKPL